MSIHIFQATSNNVTKLCTIIYKGSVETKQDAELYVKHPTPNHIKYFANLPTIDEIHDIFLGYTYNDQVIIPSVPRMIPWHVIHSIWFLIFLYIIKPN